MSLYVYKVHSFHANGGLIKMSNSCASGSIRILQRMKNGLKPCTMVMWMLSGLMAGVWGCKTVQFEYPNSRCKVIKYNPEKRITIRVVPIVDKRVDRTSTEGWSMLFMLPLVPYVSYHNYDLQGYNADVGEYDFRPLEQVRDACVDHLNLSGIASSSQSEETGKLRGKEYELRISLHKIGCEGKRTSYCLGLIPGCYIHCFGAPFNYATSYLDLELELRNAKGDVVLSRRYAEKQDFSVSMYKNWNNLKFVGFNLCRIMNRFCAEVQNSF